MGQVVIEERPYGPGNEDYEYDKWRQEQVDNIQPVRFSHLRAYGRSPAHGHHARITDAVAETVAMERGTAVHAIVFGTRKVIGYPGAVRRGKEFGAFVAEHEDCEVLTMVEYEKSCRMAAAVMTCKVAAPFLKGVFENKLLFRWMGLDCRATPDVRGDGFITELKTSANSDPARFVWHARRMAYHAQLRFQEYACAEHKHRVRDSYIVCVESDPPHPVTVFHLEPEAREEGEKLLTLWAERLKNSEASHLYPPYVDCVVPLMWPEEFTYEEAA